MNRRFDDYYNWIIERVTNEDKLVLSEGLITSYPVDVLISDLKKRYKDIEYNDKQGTFIIDNIPLPQKESLVKKLNLYGYFISDEMIDDKDNKLFSANVEAKFPSEVPFSMLHDEIQYCYHITTDRYIDKIKKIGLIPKQSVREFYKHNGNRIYFLISDNIEKEGPLLKNALMINDRQKHLGKRPQRYYILRINFHSLNNQLVFYRDPRLIPDKTFKGGAIFTLGNIPPDKIEFLGQIY